MSFGLLKRGPSHTDATAQPFVGREDVIVVATDIPHPTRHSDSLPPRGPRLPSDQETSRGEAARSCAAVVRVRASLNLFLPHPWTRLVPLLNKTSVHYARATHQ